MGPCTVSRQGANSAAQLAEIRVAVAGLNAFESRAQLRIIGDRLREHFHLAAQRHDLRLLAVRLCGQRRQRLLFGVGKPRSGAHAEGIIENDEQQTAVCIRRGAAHKRIGKGQHDQQHQRKAQREKQQMLQLAVTRGALRCRARRT